MSNIKLLSDDVINKIAAGEVVERPASVIKELVENSLDAQCSHVDIEIISGGKRLIKVSDDGVGMDSADAVKCVERYATSKIGSERDLTNLATMGFRGEALAAISAISVMKILTAKRGTTEGTFVEVHGGTIKDVKLKAASGTTVEVRDIFFNTPVRLKFLKANATENYNIMDTVMQLALANPQIGFRVYIDKKETINIPKANNIAERIMQLFDYDYFKRLLAIKKAENDIIIEGFVSCAENYKRIRSGQYLFINKRPIRDSVIRRAIYDGYGSLLAKDTHPQFFIYLTIDPFLVDFNVHPAKKEARFIEKERLYRIIKSAIMGIVQKPVEVTLPPVKYTETSVETSTNTCIEEAIPQNHGFVESCTAIFLNEKEELPQISQPSSPQPSPQPTSPLPKPSPVQAILPVILKRRYVYIGDVFVAYAENSKLKIIDHHACHERVLYEQLRDNQIAAFNQVRLLFPIHVTLNSKEYAFIASNIDKFHSMGIEIEEFGKNTFIIRALPKELDGVDMTNLLSDVAAFMVEPTNKNVLEDVKDMLSKTIACHKSVRGKHILKDEEIDKLLLDLSKTLDPGHCPHGRPTIVNFTQEDLKRMFKR